MRRLLVLFLLLLMFEHCENWLTVTQSPYGSGASLMAPDVILAGKWHSTLVRESENLCDKSRALPPFPSTSLCDECVRYSCVPKSTRGRSSQELGAKLA